MKFLAGLSNGQDLCVGRGVVHRGDLIRRFGDKLAVLCDNTTERPSAPRTDVLDGKLDGTRHEGAVRASRFDHRVIIKGVKNPATLSSVCNKDLKANRSTWTRSLRSIRQYESASISGPNK